MRAFNLKDYVNDIAAIAAANECGAADAVDYFIINLRTMSDHYKGAEYLNIRELGQAWNKLGYKERNKQQKDVVALVAKKVIIPARVRREE